MNTVPVRFIAAVFALSLVAIAAPPAFGQSAPPSAPPPAAPAPATVPAPATAASPAPKMNYIPTLDAIVRSAWATGGDDLPFRGAPFASGTTRLGGKITFPVARSIAVSYSHDYLDYMLGNSITPGNNFVDDGVDTAQITYTGKQHFAVDAGYFYRHRFCCPSAGDPTNPQPNTWHRAFLDLTDGVTLFTVPFPAVLSATITLNQTLRHHPAPAFVAAANPQIPADKGNLFYPTASVTLSLPFDRKHGATLYGTWAYTAEYFDYQLIPFWYNLLNVGFSKTAGKYVTFNADLFNITQYKSGYPFTDGNTIHVNKLVLTMDVRIGP